VSEIEIASESNKAGPLAETVLDAVDALVVVVDAEGRIVRFNRACERATGYDFEEIEGVPVWDVFIAPERVDAARTRFFRWRDGRGPTVVDLYWIRKDGHRRLVSWTMTTVSGDSDEEPLLVGTGVDVTERRAPVALASRVEPARPVTVLLVEDEPSILRFAAMALRLDGFEVIEAANAAEALVATGSREAPIDLMLTDVLMPGMSGCELARRMAELRPRTRVLFMSGYAADDRLDPDAAFLPKPFTPKDLSAKVRAVLDGAS
jgi:PAS domain S-box-containing protein